jgi:hypothetical protein
MAPAGFLAGAPEDVSMTRQHSVPATCIAGAALLALSACSPAAVEFDVVQGECQTIFGGDVCTWGVRSGAGIAEFGATVPMTMVEQAPMDVPMVFPPVADAVIALPAEVVAATGFNHLAVNWELHGHPPALFLTPHFDFHFHTTTPEAVAAVDCSDLSKPAALPSGYALPDIEIPGMGTLVGLCVPQMGMHGMVANELDDTDPFGASMIVGYYGRELSFLEPMISRTKLMDGAAFEMAVPPVPPGTPASVRWPSSFRAEYDAGTRTYRFVFRME